MVWFKVDNPVLPCYLELAIGESWVLKKPTVMVFGIISHFCPVSSSIRLGTLIFSVHLLMFCTYSCWTIPFTSMYWVFVSSDVLCLDVCLLAFGVCLFMTLFSRSCKERQSLQSTKVQFPAPKSGDSWFPATPAWRTWHLWSQRAQALTHTCSDSHTCISLKIIM